MSDWHLLGSRDPRHLGEVRVQAHWAAQIIASVGRALSTQQDDDSHTNMEWLKSHQFLAGHYTQRNPVFRLGLDIQHMSMTMLDLEGDEIATMDLIGNTLDEAYEWTESMAGDLLGDDNISLDRPEYPMPEHPIHSDQTPFSGGEVQDRLELAHWFENSAAALQKIGKQYPDAAPSRCWPHHFDIATLIPIGKDGAQTIGIGMTPGDSYYPDPYWYVTPWPYPESGVELPALDGSGIWHQNGWTGAVLRGIDLVLTQEADAQAKQVETFLQSATSACQLILNESLNA